MRKYLKYLLIPILLVPQFNCERDEICLEEITPKLIIRFYNNDIQTEIKSVFNLSVNIEGIDGEYTNESITAVTDSIAIPLKVTENITRFILTIPGDETEGTEANLDTITVIYTQEDVFISRACGYKTIFNETNAGLVDDDDNWIKDLQTVTDPQQIIDENAAHVKIYH